MVYVLILRTLNEALELAGVSLVVSFLTRAFIGSLSFSGGSLEGMIRFLRNTYSGSTTSFFAVTFSSSVSLVTLGLMIVVADVASTFGSDLVLGVGLISSVASDFLVTDF
jgi:hypothetical protein